MAIAEYDLHGDYRNETRDTFHLRNLKITRLILKGYTMRNVGRLYNMTGARASQLALRECCRMLGVKKPWHIEPKLTISFVRNKMKNRFITRLTNRIDRLEIGKDG